MKRQDRRTAFAELGTLARHLPVLGGVLGVTALSVAGMKIATHLVRELMGNGGDVTALLTVQLETLSAVSVKAMAWGERALTFLGL